MPFPTVKSDPWKKGVRKPRCRFLLWPDKFWKQLVQQAMDDRLIWDGISPACLELIREMNLLLYDHS
jgi:hypothetical protein